jgi:plastocyanin
MTDLNSRALRFTDMFGQKFLQPGLVAYRLLEAGLDLLGLDLGHHEYAIEVSPERDHDGLSHQHHVNVRFVNGQLVADPAKLRISVGDVVTWHAPDAKTPAYLVEGVGPQGAFGSASMSEQAIYTHAFGIPGRYRWVDANGTALAGDVEVADARPRTRAEAKSWAGSIATAALVHIKDGTVIAGGCVSVPVGGTVCWAVESAPAIAISDARLVEVVPKHDGDASQAVVDTADAPVALGRGAG